MAQLTRRRFLKSTALSLGAATSAGRLLAAEPKEELPPIRTITRGPRFHWFAYYDKLQFDPAGRYALSNEVDFEHRSPAAADVIKVGMVDLEDDDRWIELGESRAWCWQQGCMFQWRPGSETEVLWNDRQGDRFVCHILDVKSRKKRTVPFPVYTVSPCGKWAVAPDFRRVNDMRPGYGYAGLPDPHKDELAPEGSGIWRVDLDAGEQKLLLSLAQIVTIPYKDNLTGAKHWFNHLLVSPDGSRFEFLHRWRMEGQKGFGTRMLTAAADGSEVRVIDPSGYTSHFIWRDPNHILAWSRTDAHGDAFYLFEDRPGGSVEVVGKGEMTVNGHCSYLPGNHWILNDTYPQGKEERTQNPYLYHVATGRRTPLGHFHLPSEYSGEWRCDTHPRFSPNGKLVCIDSPHTGEGRQLHLIDISRIVG